MEKSNTCPKCNYLSSEESFSVCPKCGLIVKKYYDTLEIRQKLEAERLERKKNEEEQARLKAQREEKERLERVREAQYQEEQEKREQEQKGQEEERKKKIHSWRRVFGSFASIIGIVLIAIGLFTDPGESGTVTLHRLHIKQSLYSLGGVFLIVSAINMGIDKILMALADIYTLIKNQNIKD